MRGMGGAMRISTDGNLRKAASVEHEIHQKYVNKRHPGAAGGLQSITEYNLERSKSFVGKRHPFHGKKRKMLAYVLYLISFLMASSYARPTSNIYNQNNVIRRIFSLDESDTDSTSAVYENIRTKKEWWEWMKTSFVAAVTHEDINPTQSRGTVLELLTGVQIRQIRVQPVPCAGEIHSSRQRCFPTFAEGVEDTEPFGPANEWTWSPASVVAGYDHSVSGQFGIYESSGYVVPNVSSTVEGLSAMLTRLEEADWIGAQTRAVIVDVNIWNPSQRLISAVKMQAEFTTVGRVLPYQVVKTFEYKKWVDPARAYWYWEILFVLMVLIYSIEEAVEAINTMNSRRRLSAEKAIKSGHNLATAHVKSLVRADHLLDAYFEDPWNLMDCLNYTIAVVVIAIEFQVDLLNEQNIEVINGSNTGPDGEPSQTNHDPLVLNFVAMFGPGYLSELAYTLMGVNAVITWSKLFKYLNSFPHMAMLSKTLTNAFNPVRNFAIMFFIVFVSSGQAFNMAFGAHIENYSTAGSAMMSLFRALLGDFEYSGIQKVDSVAGPLLFVLYILLVGFILLNMFIAILAEAYAKAKVEIFGDLQAERKGEWEGAVTLIEYINLTVRTMIHHTLELPFYILRYGSEKGKSLYSAKQVGGSQWQRHQAALKKRQAVPAVVEVEDEEAALQPNPEFQTRDTGRTIDTTAKKGSVDDFSSNGALRELLHLNREVLKRLDELQEGSSSTASGLLAVAQNADNDSRKLSAVELTRLVDEQQLTVGVSSPPTRWSVPEDASTKVIVEHVQQQSIMPSSSTKPRRVAPIENPPTVQQPESSGNGGKIVAARKTPSPPILKQPGGPIVHENAPTIAFSSEVTTKEMTPVKPLVRRNRSTKSADFTPTIEMEPELEPDRDLDPELEHAAGWLRGTTKPKSSKVAPTQAGENDGSKEPTRIRTRTRVKREP